MTIRHRVSVFAGVALFAASIVSAESPQLLFDHSQIDALRERIAQPKLVPIWTKILADAEAYCNPASPRYADPQNPYSFAKKSDRMAQQRNDALQVHKLPIHIAIE